MKNELGSKTKTKFAALRPKTCSCFIDDGDEKRKTKGIKNCIIIENLNLKIINFVQKQPKLKIKYRNQKK